MTGNLQIIKNSKLRQLMSKCPNYREPKTINWRKCRAKILEGLDDFIVANANLDLETWKHTIKSKVDAKIDSLRTYINPDIQTLFCNNQTFKIFLNSCTNNLWSSQSIKPAITWLSFVSVIMWKFY